MWIPRDADEIETAVARGDLEETASFDGKAGLPDPKRNSSLAVDVAAMSTEGGTLLYGIGEDENKRLAVLSPIELRDAGDRIGQIVSTSIAEVPFIDIREYACADDPSKGYIVVVVPQSARAPHQVTVGNDRRFYGRGAKGNRRLSEGEIARLYQRRLAWEQDRDALLAVTVAAAPFRPQAELGYLHAFARPVLPDRTIWDRAVGAVGDRTALQGRLQQAAEAPEGGGLRRSWHRDDADSWRLSTNFERSPDQAKSARYVVDVAVSIDGGGRLFDGGAAEKVDLRTGPSPDGRLVIFEQNIASSFARFLRVMRSLYLPAGYHGHVDLGVSVTNIEGGYSAASAWDKHYVMWDHLPTFNAPTYARTERVAAAELDDPATIARRMLRHLFEATTRREDFDPFAV